MSDPVEARHKLQDYAEELDELSRYQSTLLAKKQEADREYETALAAFETDLWNRHVQAGEKLPSERLRTQLAHNVLAPQIIENRAQLNAEVDRVKTRITTLKIVVDAWRSVLSALKSEQEATQ